MSGGDGVARRAVAAMSGGDGVARRAEAATW